MKPAMRWMLAGVLAMPIAGCVYYPDDGYVRGDGVYYESAPYQGAYYGGGYYGDYYGGYYSGYYGPYGHSPYYWPGYYSIGISVHDHDGHRGHGWHDGHRGNRGHDARPAHRSGPEVQSRRRR